MTKQELYTFCKEKGILPQVVKYLKRVYDMTPATCEISYLKIAIKNILHSK